jgi:hypothetical protein
MSISDKALCALHNLADKHSGQDVDWISIADARVLTELGLAKRTRSGWEITPEGLSMVAQSPARTAGPATVARPWPPR